MHRMTSSTARRAGLAFLVAVAASAAIWALSPLIAGRAEPWDVEGPYYLIALFLAGLISGGLAPRPLWAQYLGAIAGQVAYQAIFLELGPLVLIGLMFLLAYSLLFVFAAALAAFARTRYSSQPPST